MNWSIPEFAAWASRRNATCNQDTALISNRKKDQKGGIIQMVSIRTFFLPIIIVMENKSVA